MVLPAELVVYSNARLAHTRFAGLAQIYNENDQDIVGRPALPPAQPGESALIPQSFSPQQIAGHFASARYSRLSFDRGFATAFRLRVQHGF